MNRTVLFAIALALVSSVFSARQATATPFPIASGSYTANVAYRLDLNSNRLTSATGSLSGSTSVQGGVPSNVVDYGFPAWQLQNMQTAGDLATLVVDLNQNYELNKIRTNYNSYLPATYRLRGSLDGFSWSPLIASSAVSGQTHTDSFSTQTVRYIEWQIAGPATLSGSIRYAYPQELFAFVASTASTPPMLTDGFNVLSGANIIATSGSSLALSYDNNASTYSTPGSLSSTTFDLGEALDLYHVSTRFYGGQTWTTGSVEISTNNVNWTTVAPLTAEGDFTFGPSRGRYVRISGQGGGALLEVAVFAQPPVPEPSTLALLGLGAIGLAIKTRRRRRVAA